MNAKNALVPDGHHYYPPLAAVLALSLMLALVAVARPAGAQGRPAGPPPLVVVMTVSVKDVNPATEYVGHVEAVQTVDLKARVVGFLEQVKFKEGDMVQAGDVLYVIEQAPYRAKVAAAQAMEQAAEAELKRADWRLKRLRAAGRESVSALDMDNAVAARLGALAQLEEAKAQLKLALIDFDYTLIKAPITGRIGKTAYTEGNLVNLSSGTLARIVQVNPIRVVYSISENDVPAIQAACRDSAQGRTGSILTPRIRLADGSMYGEAGRIDFVANEVNPATGTIAVWALFENPGGLLIPGQYVTVLVKKKKPKLMPVVPQAAVLVNKQGHYVLAVDEHDRVVPRPIVLGPSLETFWAVKNGLRPGERIIVSGIQKVRPGQQVRIRSAKDQEK